MIELHPSQIPNHLKKYFKPKRKYGPYILRNTLIWYKPNCMPSSIRDRFTVDFEYLYFFVKSKEVQYWTNSRTKQLVTKQPLGTKGKEGIDWEWKTVGEYTGDTFNVRVRDTDKDKFFQKATEEEKKNYLKGKRKKVSLWSGHHYWFEQQFEEHTESSIKRNNYGLNQTDNPQKAVNVQNLSAEEYRKRFLDPQGRNKRCVWDITTKGYPEAHFATFPEELCITPILSGCPEFVCKKCKISREKIYEYEFKGATKHGGKREGLNIDGSLVWDRPANREYKGLTDCGCNAGFEGGIVLDPFCGSGTACLVARKLFRNYIGIELKESYCEMARKRIQKEAGLL